MSMSSASSRSSSAYTSFPGPSLTENLYRLSVSLNSYSEPLTIGKKTIKIVHELDFLSLDRQPLRAAKKNTFLPSVTSNPFVLVPFVHLISFRLVEVT